MKVGYLFSVPLADLRLEQHESLDQELAELFLARESEGDKYRDPIRRDTQHGSVFESRFNVFDWPDPPVRQLAAFVHTSLASVVNSLSDYTPEEFTRLGYDERQVMSLFREPFYAGANGLYKQLGEGEVEAIVRETASTWGRMRVVDHEASPHAAAPDAEETGHE